MSRSLYMWMWIPLLLATTNGVGADTLQRTYKIDIDLRAYETRSIPIRLEVELENRGAKGLSEVWLLKYPDRYREELPHLNDLNYHRLYPFGFSKGQIDFTKMHFKGPPSVSIESSEHLQLPRETLLKLKLSSPIPPGGKLSFVFSYNLVVPEKYGSFGYFRRVLTMSGGWTPYVPYYEEGKGFQSDAYPPRATWDVKGRAQADVSIGRTQFLASEGAFRYRAEDQRQLSLQVRPSTYISNLFGRDHNVQLVLPRKLNDVLRSLRGLVIRWLEFVEQDPALFGQEPQLTLMQAPIREVLTREGEGVVLFSDRAFKVLPQLRQYHSVPIIRGLFYQLFFDMVSKRETADRYHWVADLVAWHWTDLFIRYQAYENVDARTLGPMRTFSFLPAIDRVLYTPQFAFVDAYYDVIHSVDLIRDDPLLFNHRQPTGRSIHAYLEDEIGIKKVHAIVLKYVTGRDETFRAVANDVVGRNLDEKFRQWTAPRPRVNYKLARHEQTKSDAVFRQTVTLEREHSRPISEPVELLVKTNDDKTEILRWYDNKSEHTFRFETKSPVDVLEIDPRHRLLETKLGDNRKPRLYKLVLTNLLVGFDFNAKEPNAFISAQLRRRYGGSNRYNFTAFYGGDETYGIGVGYARLFGRIIDRLRLNHGMALTFNFRQLDDDLANVVDPTTGTPTVVQVGVSQRTTSLTLGYSFGNQLSYTNPLEGGAAGASVTWGTEYLGGDADYFRLTTGGAWIVPLHPNHLLALRGLLGTSGPDSISSQVQFTLGGISGIRGLSIDDESFQGRNILLSSAEYRHFLVQDFDINLWLARIRNLQGVLFVDAGRVTNTVEERALQAFGGTTRTGFGDLFDVRKFATDFGYGIRFLVDYLGVNPGIIGFDVAKSLSEWEDTVRFYFSVTQSF